MFDVGFQYCKESNRSAFELSEDKKIGEAKIQAFLKKVLKDETKGKNSKTKIMEAAAIALTSD